MCPTMQICQNEYIENDYNEMLRHTVIQVREKASTRLEAFALLGTDMPMNNDERLATQRTMRG